MILMKYTLKDEARRKHYKALWPEFDKHFQAACDAGYCPSHPTGDDILVLIGNNTLHFTPDEVKAERTYNPKDWNDFPAITPPTDGTWMRCEKRRIDRKLIRYAATRTFLFGKWRWVDVEGIETLEPDRYRPWENEEEDND